MTFNVGDRVKVVKYGASSDPKIIGKTGTVKSLPSTGNGIFVRVILDDASSVGFKSLPCLVSELEAVVEPKPVQEKNVKFAAGDRVVILPGPNDGNSKWRGYEAEVIRADSVRHDTYLKPIGVRPDGHKTDFYWPTNQLVKSSPDVKDFRGKTISVGSTVVYPVRRSSSLWLVTGEVVDTTDSKIKVSVPKGRYGAKGYTTWVGELNRVVVLDN